MDSIPDLTDQMWDALMQTTITGKEYLRKGQPDTGKWGEAKALRDRIKKPVPLKLSLSDSPTIIDKVVTTQTTVPVGGGGVVLPNPGSFYALKYSNDTWPVSEFVHYPKAVIDAATYPSLTTIRNANPNIKLYTYCQFMFCRNPQLAGVPAGIGNASFVTFDAALAHDNANPGDLWLIRDSAGNPKLRSTTGYLLNLASASLRTQAKTNLMAIINAYAVDGFFFDDVNGQISDLITLPPGYTNATWTDLMIDWMDDVQDFLRSQGVYCLMNAGMSANPNVPENPAGDSAYWPRVAPHADGIMVEYAYSIQGLPTPNPPNGEPGGIENPLMNVDPTAWTGHWDSWYKSVKLIQDLNLDVYTIIYGSQALVNGTVDYDNQKMLYGKASYLLIRNNINAGGFAFIQSPRGGANNASPFSPLWTTDIGVPEAPTLDPILSPNEGVGYKRYFTKGVVVVNPHKDTPQLFNLGAPYTSLYDSLPYSQITVAPRRARILTKP